MDHAPQLVAEDATPARLYPQGMSSIGTPSESNYSYRGCMFSALHPIREQSTMFNALPERKKARQCRAFPQ
jgi:hypothetical protein